MDYSEQNDIGALAVALRRINHALDRHSRQQNALSGLTAPQALTLAIAAQSEQPLSIKELSTAISLSQATVTGVTMRLEAKGFIQRNRDSRDGRRTVITLTPAGQSALRLEAGMLPSRFLQAFSSLSERRRKRLLSGVLDLAFLLAEPPPMPINKDLCADSTVKSDSTINPRISRATKK